MLVLRDEVHEGHGFTPFELVYGRSTRGPMKILKELWTREEETRSEYQHMLDLQKKISETCRIAQEELEKNQKRIKKYYHQKARFRKLDIGDRVMILLPLKPNKMMMKWIGPYEVVDKIGKLDYRVKISIWHCWVKTYYYINMLKKYIHRESGEINLMESHELAVVITVVNDGEIGNEEEMLELFNGKQKETYREVQN